MVIKSDDGFTVTLTGAVVGVIPVTELVAVTVNVITCGAASGGTFGATKVCTEPLTAPGLSVMPAGAVQVNVSLPAFGSTRVAVSVTIDVPSPVTGFGVAEALTERGVPARGTAIGTDTVAVAGVLAFVPPTMS